MSPVDVGVIGLGFMGGRWAQCLAEHPGARLRVVSDVREDLGRQLADRWEATYVADPLEAAADPALRGVAVCTPEHLHVDVALAAIEAGKLVMVVKPLAHTVSDAERIRDRAAELDTPVLAGHILRFEPRYAAVARAVHEGEIGEVQAVRNERIGLVSDQVVLQGRTTVPLYYGVHEFDLARWDLKRVIVVNGHGGNVDAIRLAARTARRDHGVLVSGLMWAQLAAQESAAHASSNSYGHACEIETSVAMVLAPSSVNPELVRPPGGHLSVGPLTDPPAPKADRPTWFEEWTEDGALGNPTQATKETGAAVVEAAYRRALTFARDFANESLPGEENERGPND